MRLVCQVFRSSRKEHMYLYVEKSRGLKDVPEALMSQFGEASEVMTLLLDSQRKLALADAGEVLKSITDEGFYLQMPPSEAEALFRGSSGE